MANLVQRVLVRTDLGMPTGLLAAQVAHIHATPLIQSFKRHYKQALEDIYVENVKEWMTTPYLFVHAVPNKEVLDYFITECSDKQVRHNEWIDTVYVDISPTQKKVFSDVLIGVSIGPADSDDIKTIVGDLPLL